MASCACPVCAAAMPDGRQLADHLVERAEQSDARHVMWLNRNVTKLRTSAEDLVPLLDAALAGDTPTAAHVPR